MEVPYLQVKDSPNARTSQNRKRNKVGNQWRYTKARGIKKYFIYSFNRYMDSYIFIIPSTIFPIKFKDGFKKEDLKKVADNKEEVLKYLSSLKTQISFSPSSLKFNITNNYEL